jgi:aspartyl-tRNA(Asn)/glutamyl-tRNA(Gln) amidotransferase subunit A
MGWLFRDLQDGPTLGGVFPAAQTTPPTPMNPDAFRRLLTPPRRFAVVDERFLEDCEPAVRESLASVVAELQSLGMTPTTISVDWWSEARDIFAPIQASEAAQIHAGNFAAIAPEIRQRLEWGASLSSDEVAKLRERHAEFRGRMDALLAEHEFLLMPAAPVAMLAAGADHSQTRIRLLRYTTPVSLAGMPAVTIPVLVDGKPAGGMQLIAAREEDQRLLKLTAKVGEKRKSQLKSLG